MTFNIITIFPNIVLAYTKETILQRAIRKGIVKVSAVDLRDFTTDKHRTVDDTPYGGGAGMVLKPEPIYKSLKHLNALKRRNIRKYKRTVLLSPRGRQFDQRIAEEWAKLKEITFVCGRYEGVDQRVVEHMVDEEVSIGPYVLAGGELGALVIVEAIMRLLPGVLGNIDSLKEETFSAGITGVEYPQYTKPEAFHSWKVPEVLLSGHHKKIDEWRKNVPTRG